MFRLWLWLWLFRLSSFVFRLSSFQVFKFQVPNPRRHGILHSSLFTLHFSYFTCLREQSYEESLTQIPVMIHLRALMIYLWYSYVQLRAIRCTYEGSQLLKWRGSPLGMPMRRCKNGVEKMQKRYLTEHEDTKTQRTMTMTMTMTFCPLFFVFRFSFL